MLAGFMLASRLRSWFGGGGDKRAAVASCNGDIAAVSNGYAVYSNGTATPLAQIDELDHNSPITDHCNNEIDVRMRRVLDDSLSQLDSFRNKPISDWGLPSELQHIVTKVVDTFHVDDDKLRRFKVQVRQQIDVGLDQKERSSFEMIPTYVTQLSDDLMFERCKGRFLGLDLSGHSLRLAVMTFNVENDQRIVTHQRSFKVPSSVARGTGDALFDYLAAQLHEFCEQYDAHTDNLPLGVTLAFPLTHSSLTNAQIKRWCKGYAASDVVGRDFGDLLKAAIERIGNLHVRVVAVANDTVSTFMCTALDRSAICDVAIICGQDTNAAIVAPQSCADEVKVHSHLAQMHFPSVVDAASSLAVTICRSGYHFPESDLGAKFLTDFQLVGTRVGKDKMGASPRSPFQLMDDFSGLPRCRVHSGFLLELLNCIYFALFNGAAQTALPALDSLHQRTCFEMFPDVLLATNAIINSMLENASGAPSDEGPMGIRVVTSQHFQEKSPASRRNVVTNASLRVSRMPEDIPIKDEGDGAVNRTGSGKKEGELASAFKKKLSALRPEALKPPGREQSMEWLAKQQRAATAKLKHHMAHNRLTNKDHHHQQPPGVMMAGSGKHATRLGETAPLLEESSETQPEVMIISPGSSPSRSTATPHSPKVESIPMEELHLDNKVVGEHVPLLTQHVHEEAHITDAVVDDLANRPSPNKPSGTVTIPTNLPPLAKPEMSVEFDNDDSPLINKAPAPPIPPPADVNDSAVSPGLLVNGSRSDKELHYVDSVDGDLYDAAK